MTVLSRTGMVAVRSASMDIFNPTLSAYIAAQHGVIFALNEVTSKMIFSNLWPTDND